MLDLEIIYFTLITSCGPKVTWILYTVFLQRSVDVLHLMITIMDDQNRISLLRKSVRAMSTSDKDTFKIYQ